MPAVGHEQVGRVLGRRYRLVAPVGAGASAVVFVADDVVLKRRVAVKLLHPSLADDPMFLKRFRAEAQAAAALNHPNVMAVHDWGEEGGTPFLVTELLSGGSLRAMLDRNRLLSPSQALLVGLDAARGLDYADRRGLVHRDIKPANLLFDDDGRLRIADFGLARALAEAAWTEPAGVVLGTARYASPEQARGLAVDGRSDVYSLALVLIESVTGQVPFVADTTVATLMNRIDKLMPVSADLGPLAAIVERAGRPQPEERYTSAELGRALIQTAERLPRPAPLPIVSSVSLALLDDTQLPPSAAGSAGLAHAARSTGGTNGAAVVAAGATGAPAGVTVAGGQAGASGSSGAAVADAPGSLADAPEGLAGAELETAGGTGPAARAGLADVAAPGWADEPAAAPTANGTTTGLAAAATAAPAPAGPAGGSVGPAGPDGPPVLYDEEPARPRRRWRKVVGVLAGVLALVAIAAGVVLYRRASVPSYPVPPLVGVDIAKARNIVSQYSWKVDERRARNDTYDKGMVYQQDPTDGNLARGGSIVLYVSDGPNPAKLPDLVGQAQASAQQQLTAAGLTLGKVTPQYDETVPAGTVMAWSVGGHPLTPGTEVPKGTTVDLTVSGGPQPRTIPKLVGQPFAAAVAQLQQQGLVAQQVADVFSDTVAPGSVAASNPTVGNKVARGTTVQLAVSKGPDVVTVPNVVNMDLQAAVAALQAAGLAQGTIAGPIDAKVRATDPGPTAVVKRGTPVNITMA